MNPAVKYTLGRLGIFVVVFAAILPIPLVENIFVKAMVALLASAGLSFVLLRTWREQMNEQIAGAMVRRKEQKENLRSALAGDDDPKP